MHVIGPITLCALVLYLKEVSSYHLIFYLRRVFTGVVEFIFSSLLIFDFFLPFLMVWLSIALFLLYYVIS